MRLNFNFSQQNSGFLVKLKQASVPFLHISSCISGVFSFPAQQKKKTGCYVLRKDSLNNRKSLRFGSV